jgi:DNA-binding beta-propeller fold protein YncE
MRFGRLQCLILTVALVGMLGATAAFAGPLAVIANFTDPGLTATAPWPPGTVTILDTGTDKPVGSPLTVGVNPMAVAITPDGKTAVVACSQSSDIWWIDLSANPPKVTGNLSLGTGTGDTFYPAGLAISPDGQYVAVTSLSGSQPLGGQLQHFTNTRYLKIVNMTDRSVNSVDLQNNQLLDENGKPFAGAAEAAVISSKGAIVIISPTTNNGEIYALPYAVADGQINFPDTADGQRVGVMGHTGFNIALTPDGSTGIIPLWRNSADKKGYLDVVTLDDTGKLVITDDSQGPHLTQEKVDAGGSGTHSVAITADGTKAYVRNLISPGNIEVFRINADHTITDTKVSLNAEGIPDSVWQLIKLASPSIQDPQAAGAYVGSEMLAVTPDGQKVYAVNPFAGPPDPIFQLLGIDGYGDGELQVFKGDQPTPITTLKVGKNPIAVAIQPK